MSISSQEITLQIEEQQIQEQQTDLLENQGSATQNVQEGAAVVSTLSTAMEQMKTQMS